MFLCGKEKMKILSTDQFSKKISFIDKETLSLLPISYKTSKEIYQESFENK